MGHNALTVKWPNSCPKFLNFFCVCKSGNVKENIVCPLELVKKYFKAFLLRETILPKKALFQTLSKVASDKFNK